MEKFFQLKANGTTAGREVVAGLTTFFAMAYLHQNPLYFSMLLAFPPPSDYTWSVGLRPWMQAAAVYRLTARAL